MVIFYRNKRFMVVKTIIFGLFVKYPSIKEGLRRQRR